MPSQCSRAGCPNPVGYRRKSTKRPFCSLPCWYASRADEDAERFWSKVNKDGPVPDPSVYPDLGPCWILTGATNTDGRGVAHLQGRQRVASIVAYILDRGHEPPPDAPLVTHLCDGGFTGCVRPSHLKADTQVGNLAGASERGRMARGERNSQAKRTTEEIVEIRRRYAAGGISQRQLAAEFKMSQSAIGLIVRGEKWRHLIA